MPHTGPPRSLSASRSCSWHAFQPYRFQTRAAPVSLGHCRWRANLRCYVRSFDLGALGSCLRSTGLSKAATDTSNEVSISSSSTHPLASVCAHHPTGAPAVERGTGRNQERTIPIHSNSGVACAVTKRSGLGQPLRTTPPRRANHQTQNDCNKRQ